MKVKLLVVPVMLFLLFLTACGEIFNQDSQVESSDQDSQIGSSDISLLEEDDKALSMNKLIFSYSARYPESEKANCEYYLFVQSDGSIYSGVYSDFYAKQYEFQKQLYSFNNVDFDLLDDVNHLGNLSDSETEKLCSLIENVDLGSEAYKRGGTESIPTVVDTASYTYYCYPIDSKKTAFRIAIVRNWTGVSYKTFDENALEVLDIIQSNALVTEWEEGCSKENDAF